MKRLFLPLTKEMRRPICGEATFYPGGCMALRKLHYVLKVPIQTNKDYISRTKETKHSVFYYLIYFEGGINLN